MADNTDLIIKLRADTKLLRKELKSAKGTFKKFQKDSSSIANQFSKTLIAAFAGRELIMGIKNAAKAYDIQAKAIAQVATAIESTGAAAGKNLKELEAQASQLQQNTIFGDEDILKNATAQLLTFTNIAGEQFDRTQKAALDLATRLDGDLKSASIQLGKALNDPVANLSALSRSGIQFSKEQKKVINELVKTNKLAEAQTIILNELEKQYGGSAEAAAEAGLGGFQQLSNSIGDLQEVMGEILTGEGSQFLPFLKSLVKGTEDAIKKIAGIDELSQRLERAGLDTNGGIISRDTAKKLIEFEANLERIVSNAKKNLKEGIGFDEVNIETLNASDALKVLNSRLEALRKTDNLYYKEISQAFLPTQQALTKEINDETEALRKLEEQRTKMAEKSSVGGALGGIESKAAPGIEGGVGLPLIVISDESVEVALEKNRQQFKRIQDGIITDLEALSMEINMTLERTVESAIIGVASAIGSGGGLEAAFSVVLGVLADGMSQIGKAMIAYGIAGEAFKKSIESLQPGVAIAAGVALVAAAGALKSAQSNFASSYSGGGSSGGGSQGFQFERSGQSISISGELVARGQDMVVVLDEANRQNSRNVG